LSPEVQGQCGYSKKLEGKNDEKKERKKKEIK
jgi:hypothetical protein